MLGIALALAFAPQNGDVKGEEQPPLREDDSASVVSDR